MRSFTYTNPTTLVFGTGTIAQLPEQVPAEARVLLLYGQGSIKRNGVYDQVKAAMAGFTVFEYDGIEPNPRYETCMGAVEACHTHGIDFLLAVGGGSVVDAAKFIAAAARYDEGDPWDLLARHLPVHDAIPLGCVLTLPATGSESNGGSVISRTSTGEKLFFVANAVFPRFAILDPQVTTTLSPWQTANGIVDAFVHVMEQYATYDVDSPLQDRQAEAILATLVEQGPRVMANPDDVGARANVMWCATQGLNGLIGCGVVQDWATHMIGHELTALWGLDHARSLAVVLPGVLRYQKAKKQRKLAQLATRVFSVREGSEAERADAAIEHLVAFFYDLGVATDPAECGVPDDGWPLVAKRLADRGMVLGEHRDLGPEQVVAIGALCV